MEETKLLSTLLGTSSEEETITFKSAGQEDQKTYEGSVVHQNAGLHPPVEIEKEETVTFKTANDERVEPTNDSDDEDTKVTTSTVVFQENCSHQLLIVVVPLDGNR